MAKAPIRDMAREAGLPTTATSKPSKANPFAKAAKTAKASAKGAKKPK